jgi:MmyB-like transcription regulator ligand binding domain
VGELSTRSEDFRGRWAAHDVRIHSTGIKKQHHPLVGDLDLPYESLPIELGSTTSLVTYLAEPGYRPRTHSPSSRAGMPARCPRTTPIPLDAGRRDLGDHQVAAFGRARR